MKKILVSFAAVLILSVFAVVGSNASSFNSMFIRLNAGDSASAKAAQKIEQLDGVKSVFYNPENGVVSILYNDGVKPETIESTVTALNISTGSDVTTK